MLVFLFYFRKWRFSQANKGHSSVIGEFSAAYFDMSWKQEGNVCVCVRGAGGFWPFKPCNQTDLLGYSKRSSCRSSQGGGGRKVNISQFSCWHMKLLVSDCLQRCVEGPAGKIWWHLWARMQIAGMDTLSSTPSDPKYRNVTIYFW